MMRSPQKMLTLIVALAVVGIAVSTYAFLHNRAFVSGSFCTIGETFDCDVVNKGPYSQLFGIPVALIGIIGYVFLMATALLKKRQLADRTLTLVLVLAALGGLGFAAYLTGIEAFVLRTWCLLCLTSQLSILAISILAVRLWHEEKNLNPTV